MESLNSNFSTLEVLLNVQNSNPLIFSTWSYSKTFFVVFTIVSSFVGTLGNIFIIGAVLLEKKLRYLGNVFIVNLAIADILVTGYVFPVTTVNVLYETSVLPRPGCIITALITVYSCMTSQMNLAFIAFDRYCFVCHDAFHRRFFTRTTVAIMVIITWLNSIIATTPPLFYLDDLRYDPRNEMCIITFSVTPKWFGYAFISLCIFTPMCLTFVFYAKIFMTIRASKRRVGVHTNANTNKTKKSESDVYKTLFLVLVIFVISWTPGGLSVIANNLDIQIPKELYRFCFYIALTNSIINSFIYGITNKQFRNGYVSLFKIIMCNFACVRYSKSPQTTVTATESTRFNNTSLA